MPAFQVVVGLERLLEDAPLPRGEHRTLNPLSLDIVNQTPQLLCLGLGLKADEHWTDFLVWKEREGHYFSDIFVGRIVTRVSGLKAKLLYL